ACCTSLIRGVVVGRYAIARLVAVESRTPVVPHARRRVRVYIALPGGAVLVHMHWRVPHNVSCCCTLGPRHHFCWRTESAHGSIPPGLAHQIVSIGSRLIHSRLSRAP